MNRSRRQFAVALAAFPLAATLARGQAKDSQGFRTAQWEELVPPGWDPMQQFRDINPGQVAEGSPEERLMMRELRQVWDAAPTRVELNGARLRLPGFVVPLDPNGNAVKEFLLVPYFGACIHSPPPPANQIVHVELRAPRPLRTMESVWVSGVVRTQRQNSPWGYSGYFMQGQGIEPYKP